MKSRSVCAWVLTFLFAVLLLVVYRWPFRPASMVSLRELADKSELHLGVTDAGFGTSLYENTVAVNFNSLTPESVMKFENIHPCPPLWLIESNSSISAWVEQHGAERSGEKYHCSLEQVVQDEWEWEDTDLRVEWARKHGIGFRGHTFLWVLQNPGWLIDPSINLSVEERRRIMTGHIQGVIEHYCAYENVYAYDVINEAVRLEGGLVEMPWSGIPDYIAEAFRVARDALDQCGRSDVKLFYNDFEFEYGGEKADAIYTLLHELLMRNDPVPIDGIGFQAHSQFLADGIESHDPTALLATMDRFTHGLGLEVVITETDLPIVSSQPWAWYETQAIWYAERLQACLDAQHCTGFTTWGTHDGSSWRNYVPHWGDVDALMFHDAAELIFDPTTGTCLKPVSNRLEDETFCPKKAYWSVYELLSKY